jgi:integrase
VYESCYSDKAEGFTLACVADIGPPEEGKGCQDESDTPCSEPVARRVYDEANPGKSTRQSAADRGVSRKAVRTARKEGDNHLSPAVKAMQVGELHPVLSKNWAPLADRWRPSSWTASQAPQRPARHREAIMRQLIKAAGNQPCTKITQAKIIEGRDRRGTTPAQARHFLETMRGLFKWAVKAKHVTANPTIGVEDPARPKNSGFPVWTEDQVAAYERRWSVGTRQRVWLDVLIYTGLRRGDAVRLGRQHVRNGIATIKTEKSGFELEVILPILPVLAETLRAGPCGELTFIVGANSKPLDKRSFGNQFRKACRAAGVKRSAHGLRKIAATRAANAGATVAQLEAIFGWIGGRMASHYTRTADRRRLSTEAMHKLANDERTSIPAPKGKVRASEGIDE